MVEDTDIKKQIFSFTNVSSFKNYFIGKFCVCVCLKQDIMCLSSVDLKQGQSA